MNTELVTVNTTEGAAYGAAVLVRVGVRRWPDVETACDDLIHFTEAVHPREKHATVYERLYPIYREVYPRLKPVFEGLSTIWRLGPALD